jgi:hypothetical protein
MQQMFDAVIDVDRATELKSARRRVLAQALAFRTNVSPSSALPRSSSSPLIRVSLSQSASRLPLRASHPPNTTELPAFPSSASFTMSADDIDDELFALAGGDEDADIEEGEA